MARRWTLSSTTLCFKPSTICRGRSAATPTSYRRRSKRRCATLWRRRGASVPPCMSLWSRVDWGEILMLGKLNHVAIAVRDLAAAAAVYRDALGADVSDPVPLPEHGVRV